jgi:hypothetical protein
MRCHHALFVATHVLMTMQAIAVYIHPNEGQFGCSTSCVALASPRVPYRRTNRPHPPLKTRLIRVAGHFSSALTLWPSRVMRWLSSSAPPPAPLLLSSVACQYQGAHPPVDKNQRQRVATAESTRPQHSSTGRQTTS